ncbi:hypothetical protein A0H81_13422 [Grifola frondosa]|uniref:Uncharacterized protein n=1 Tax=Grifola frondosa TaxID=5627 RepID=A0A1C7LPX8_GRIFR|nr:hypothetical protein A0H81_13422 [Grifola frondosa]
MMADLSGRVSSCKRTYLHGKRKANTGDVDCATKHFCSPRSQQASELLRLEHGLATHEEENNTIADFRLIPILNLVHKLCV